MPGPTPPHGDPKSPASPAAHAGPVPYNAAVEFVDSNVARGRGNKVAFIDPKRQLTYAELKERTDRFANALPRLGIGRERRIVLILLDTVDFPPVFWGAIKAGVIPVPINTLMTPEQWRFVIQDSRADAVVLSHELLPQAAPLLADLGGIGYPHVIVTGAETPAQTLSLEGLLASSDPVAEAVPTIADEVAFWLYSSGSTGTPKGVKHIHSSLAYTASLYGRDVLGIREDDVTHSAAKLFFAYGLGNGMTFPMSVGATAILNPDRPTPDVVQALMAQHQVSLFFGAPTLYAAMLASPNMKPGAGSSRLRMCVSAGEALPEDIGKRWKERAGTDILDGIGSTEMLHIFVSNRPGHIRYGTSGTPVPGYEAMLLDETGAAVPQGEIGELVVSGPTAGDGYWNQRQKSRKTFAGEWTYTGDKYRIDEQGCYVYCGRTDDMFKVSGIWVSPFEVESALISHPSVLEAAVVAREDSDGLIKPMAYVILKPGHKDDPALFETLKEHVKTTAGPWKYPRWIEVRDDLPKTATGKIQRFKLRAETTTS
jgi:4-hydroxybenzoate-CoA ligase